MAHHIAMRAGLSKMALNRLHPHAAGNTDEHIRAGITSGSDGLQMQQVRDLPRVSALCTCQPDPLLETLTLLCSERARVLPQA